MGKKRPFIPEQSYPESLLADNLKLATRSSFSRRVISTEPSRNELLRETFLECGLGLIESFSDEVHGTDALWSQDFAGLWRTEDAPVCLTELKSQNHPEAGEEENKFWYPKETIQLYQRLLQEHQILYTVRKLPNGLEYIVECWVCYVGSPLHELFQTRMQGIISGERLPRRFSLSLAQVKKLGGVKLIGALERRSV